MAASTTFIPTTTVTTPYECTFWSSDNLSATATSHHVIAVVLGTETVTTTISGIVAQTTTDKATVTTADDASSITSKQTTSLVATSADHSTTISQSRNSGVSTGAIAGIAVGCAVVGLIFGFAAAWLLHRRWTGKSLAGDVKVVTTTPESKGYASIVTSPIAASASGSDSQIDQFLLAATPDKEIGAELQALGDLIHQHVENHYNVGTMTVSSSLLSQHLVNLGFTSGPTSDAVAGLCINPKSRQAGLRHVISTIVFKSIDVNSRSSLSMLPAPLAAFLQSIPFPEQHPGNPLSKHPIISTLGNAAIPESNLQSLVVPVALSKWRHLSALLLHPNAAERTPLPVSEELVAPQALALANALNTFLHYFVGADGVRRDEQTSHLQAVIIECTKLGYVLLSQPSDWQFVFGTDHPGSGRSSLVVCPGLEKLSHGDGTRYSSPRRVLEPIPSSYVRQSPRLRTESLERIPWLIVVGREANVPYVPARLQRRIPTIRSSFYTSCFDPWKPFPRQLSLHHVFYYPPSPSTYDAIMGGSINPLRRLTNLTIEYDQVPSEIRSCLELVRTCNKDLQLLIELRNEHLALLEQQTETLDRVNSIIEAAHVGLSEACEVVERCRPGAHRGKTPFRNRMKWILGDSLQFRNHEPVISRHHSAVLAELIFVRQMALWSPVADQQKAIESRSIEKAPLVFDNIALLGDFMGDVPGK
ncbi:hypothetical protein EDB81DRAFT_663142 [Dactylonectria macrodidyma]|uniref:Transmembrane protein n=1 Tax=Dactylonectria macrodidyma TaxID=307937 RepID=A0A9P9IP26_9HYPO|nr:hypothetical protein EDB81DRAFT_663142 [Dactylonectria macrodidyma]